MTRYQEFRFIALGNQQVWTKDKAEVSTRLLVWAFFIAPALFVCVELSPTAWGVIAPLLSIGLLSRWQTRFYGTAIFLFGVTSLAALSSLWSIDPLASITATLNVFFYSALGCMLINNLMNAPDESKERIERATLYGAAISLVILIGFELYAAVLGLRLDATFHKITFYGLICAIFLWCRTGSAFRVLVAIFSIITLAFGRSVGVSLAIVFFALLSLLPDDFRRRSVWAALVIYAVAALAAPFVVKPVFQILDRIGVLSFYPGTFAARLDLWQMIATYIPDALWLGHGANTTRSAVWIIADKTYYGQPDLPSAHNVVFDLWFELGVVGVALLVSCLFSIARRVGRSATKHYLLRAGIVIAFLIEMSVDHRIWLSWVLGAMIFGASICVLYHRRNVT